MDYLNLPAGVGHQANDNKRRAKKMATTARHWCLRCKWIQKRTNDPLSQVIFLSIILNIFIIFTNAWYSTGYEVTRNSGVTVPGVHGRPAIPTYAVVPAATRPKWQARWKAHVSAHNNGALPARDLYYIHQDIWVLDDANFTPRAPGTAAISAPARRAANIGVYWLVGPVARATWHSHIRQPQGQAGIPGGWNTLNPVEKVTILQDCMGYQPLGGFPLDPGANAVTLTTPDAMNLALGCFFDRLPEFLCQLGDCSRAIDFV